MLAIQEQAWREIIDHQRAKLGVDELYIIAPGMGEDVIIDGVPIYGSFAESITGYPPGSCIVMTRETWERNLDVLVPSLAEITAGEIEGGG
jgi:hypothetical protein